MDNINSTENNITIKIFDSQAMLASFQNYELFWKEGSKTNIKFLSKSEVENHLAQIKKYPKAVRQEEAVQSFKKLHTMCARDGWMLATCMNKTYCLRQYDIRTKKMNAGQIIKKYPGLMDFYQIKDEFERVKQMEEGKFLKGIHKLVEEYNPDYLSKRRISPFTHQFWKDEAGEVNCPPTAKLRVFIFKKMGGDLINELIVYKLAEEQGEAPDQIERLQPTILVDGSIWSEYCATVYCDKVKVVTGLSFFNAFLSVYFLNYVFDIKYAPNEVNMWKDFDEVLGSVQDTDSSSDDEDIN